MKTLSAVADAPRSLGRFLRNEMGLSQHMIASLKPRNLILVNGEPRHTNYYLKPGDVVEVSLPQAPAFSAPAEGKVDVVYEDGNMLVIDKPAPLPTMASVRQGGDTLEGRLAGLYPDMAFRPVNRLDKGTSGLMIAAKDPHAQYVLSDLLHSDAFVREYLAVLEGEMEMGGGVIDLPIRKAEGATVRREVHPDGAPCVTRYEVLECRSGLSLVRLRLETGRTHQIRVHMAHMGHPVFGDFLYGRESDRLPGRFGLHSHRILLKTPQSPVREFLSPLPEEISRLMET